MERSPTKHRDLSRVSSALTSSVLVQYGRKDRKNIISASSQHPAQAMNQSANKEKPGTINKLKFLDS